MSNPYLICNLDRRECLSPQAFARVRVPADFVFARQSIMSVVALLTLDAVENVYDDLGLTETEFAPIANKDLIGSWAGQRIVTVNERVAPGKYLTADEVQAGIAAMRQYNQDADFAIWDDPFNFRTRNLYQYASLCYADISGPSLELCTELRWGYFASDDQLFLRAVRDVLGRSLTHDFGQRRDRQDFTWLNIHHLDRLMSEYIHTKAQLGAFKKWLRRHRLQPAVRELLTTYRAGPDGVTCNWAARARMRHDVTAEAVRPLLPSAAYLDAATRLEAQDNGAPRLTSDVTTAAQRAAMRQLTAALPTPRTRSIQLDGS